MIELMLRLHELLFAEHSLDCSRRRLHGTSIVEIRPMRYLCGWPAKRHTFFLDSAVSLQANSDTSVALQLGRLVCSWSPHIHWKLEHRLFRPMIQSCNLPRSDLHLPQMTEVKSDASLRAKQVSNSGIYLWCLLQNRL